MTSPTKGSGLMSELKVEQVGKMTKPFVNDHTLPHSPTEQMARAMRDLSVTGESEYLQEGLAAFREKWPAKFSGR